MSPPEVQSRRSEALSLRYHRMADQGYSPSVNVQQKIDDVFNRIVVCVLHERQKRDDLEHGYYEHNVESEQLYKTHTHIYVITSRKWYTVDLHIWCLMPMVDAYLMHHKLSGICIFY